MYYYEYSIKVRFNDCAMLGRPVFDITMGVLRENGFWDVGRTSIRGPQRHL